MGQEMAEAFKKVVKSMSSSSVEISMVESMEI